MAYSIDQINVKTQIVYDYGIILADEQIQPNNTNIIMSASFGWIYFLFSFWMAKYPLMRIICLHWANGA